MDPEHNLQNDPEVYSSEVANYDSEVAKYDSEVVELKYCINYLKNKKSPKRTCPKVVDKWKKTLGSDKIETFSAALQQRKDELERLRSTPPIQ